MGIVRLSDLTRNPDQHEVVEMQSEEGQLAALRLAIRGAEEDGERLTAMRADQASGAIHRIREVADFLRASDERISDLEAGVQAITERARRDLKAAQEHAAEAELRVSAQAARADRAEHRAREAEERLGEIMAVIQQELTNGHS